MTLVERLRRLSEDAQIQRALKDGKTIAQIVAECGVTVARVQKQRVVLRAILGDNRRKYAAKCQRIKQALGDRAEWFSPQDWMCEPIIINGGRTKDGQFCGTGLSVEQHQRLTVANYLDLRKLLGELVVPVVQGWTIYDYWRCLEMYRDAGVDLSSCERVGVGSVCRRQGSNDAVRIMQSIASETGNNLHGYGFKKDGYANCHQYMKSGDSFAWSYCGRRRPDPTHVHYLQSAKFVPEHKGKVGYADDCAQCPDYALQWRFELLEQLAVLNKPAQLELTGLKLAHRWSTDTLRVPK